MSDEIEQQTPQDRIVAERVPDFERVERISSVEGRFAMYHAIDNALRSRTLCGRIVRDKWRGIEPASLRTMQEECASCRRCLLTLGRIQLENGRARRKEARKQIERADPEDPADRAVPWVCPLCAGGSTLGRQSLRWLDPKTEVMRQTLVCSACAPQSGDYQPPGLTVRQRTKKT